MNYNAISNSSNIEIVEGRGRSFIARKHYEPGEIIFIEEAFCSIVSEDFKEVCCCYCCKLCVNVAVYSLNPLDPSRYCSEYCIKQDYELHQLESDVLNELYSSQSIDASDNIRLLIRIAVIFKQQSKTSHEPKPKYVEIFPITGRNNTKETINLLEANAKFIHKETLDDIELFSKTLSNLLEKYDLLLSRDEVMTILLMIQCNAHRISFDTTVAPLTTASNTSENNNMTTNQFDDILPRISSAIALGLFPYFSMINHSCTPNAYHDFIINSPSPSPSGTVSANTRNSAVTTASATDSGSSATDNNKINNLSSGNHTSNITASYPQIRLRAIQHIQHGEEVTYSYVPLYDTTHNRRLKLQHAYSFICDCARCSANEKCSLSNINNMSHNSNSRHNSDKGGDGSEAIYPNDNVLDFITHNNHVTELLDEIISCIGSCYASLTQLVLLLQKAGYSNEHHIDESRSDNDDDDDDDPFISCYDDLFRLVIQIYSLHTTTVHPCHRTLMMAYVCLARYSYVLFHYVEVKSSSKSTSIDDDDKNDTLMYLYQSVLFGWLALGCVCTYTQQNHRHLGTSNKNLPNHSSSNNSSKKFIAPELQGLINVASIAYICLIQWHKSHQHCSAIAIEIEVDMQSKLIIESRVAITLQNQSKQGTNDIYNMSSMIGTSDIDADPITSICNKRISLILEQLDEQDMRFSMFMRHHSEIILSIICVGCNYSC